MKKLLLFVGILFINSFLFSQGITTASAYFKTISEYYAGLKDYECDFEIKIERQESAGTLSYKAPDLIRLDYTNPEEQVICFNGETLSIYLAETTTGLQQQVTPGSSASAASIGSAQGLSLMSRYYSVAYETGQDPEPLDAESDEMVVKFLLTKKSAAEAFRYIKVAVSADTKLIRRIEAVTSKGETFLFNFYEYKLNQGIADQRFVYEIPSKANVYNNFLFSE
ncbi:MAG: outer membrane lipoprotein carrier protein LolA [Treponema sp.]|jgi:outer membrane lipoprotein-sorting protein|nr:outer membrane lipoprotein carrier protein LolA [Treponema sp.]